jgi:hypothetical protein
VKKKKKNQGGRPNVLGDTVRVTYNLTLIQANFIVAQAMKNEATESEMMRALIDYVMAQYAVDRVKR